MTSSGMTKVVSGASGSSVQFFWLGPAVLHGVVGPRRTWRVVARCAATAPGVTDVVTGIQVSAVTTDADAESGARKAPVPLQTVGSAPAVRVAPAVTPVLVQVL